MKKRIRVIGWGLMAAGLVVLGFLAYQYWYTDLAAARGQQEGAASLRSGLPRRRPRAEVTPSGQPDANPRPNKVVIPPAELFTEEPPEPGTPSPRCGSRRSR